MSGNSIHSPSEVVRAAIRKVLLEDWDPYNAGPMPGADNAYDIYIDPLCKMIAGGIDEQTLVDWLHAREQDTLCFPSLGTRRLNRVAKKLLAAARQ